MGVQLHSGLLSAARGTRAALVLVAAAGFFPRTAAAADPPSARAVFERRVGQYAALHKAAERALPSLPRRGNAAALSSHQAALAEGIRRRRADARPGDLLCGEVGVFLRGLIAAELATSGGQDEEREIREQNPETETPAQPVTVAVNAAYAEGASLSTVPAGLLLRLPPLPPQLDYRFVGRDLVLRDTVAHLIVDYIENALP